MNIEQDAVVTIAYTLTDDDGNVVDSSKDTGDLAYLHGHQNIVPGLEEALSGKAVGDQISTSIAPEKGYGDREEQLVFQVPRDRLPQDQDLEIGMQFRAQASDGQEMIVAIAEIGDELVMLDANHPLAGQTLNFEVEIKGVREATPDELEHGHVHGDGGVHN
jgi:FKBP-type peptidyl-prolyl cis-trans isomerase SlyD